MIECRCPVCGAVLRIPDKYAGTTGVYDHCNVSITVPGGAPGTPATPDLPAGLTRDLSKAMHVPPADIGTDLEARGAVVNAKDGSILVPIRAGQATFGSNSLDQAAVWDGKPEFRAKLPVYYIAAHPVTVAQYSRFMDETMHRPPCEPDGTGAAVARFYEVRASKADHPVVCVGWIDTLDYCRWSGLRLPSELEWEKAARGPSGLVYPWGDEWDAGNCRNKANMKSTGIQTTCSVWEYASGVGPYGTYHHSGNVWEWCSDWFERDAYKRYAKGDMAPPAQNDHGYLVIRGGSWGEAGPREFRGAYREFKNRDCLYGTIGFRCARGLE